MPKLALRRLSEAQNNRCCYCSIEMTWPVKASLRIRPEGPATATVDHYFPRIKGGTRIWDNVVAACLRCNTTRGDCDAMVFWSLMQKHASQYHLVTAAINKMRTNKIVRPKWRTGATVPEMSPFGKALIKALEEANANHDPGMRGP